jgi:hypothetical protein
VIFTLRYFIPANQLAEPPVIGGGPNGQAYPLPILQCEKCGALISADMEGKHTEFHMKFESRL